MSLKLTYSFALASGLVSALGSTPLATSAGSVEQSGLLATADLFPYHEPNKTIERIEIQNRQLLGHEGQEHVIIRPYSLDRDQGDRICTCKTSTTQILFDRI